MRPSPESPNPQSSGREPGPIQPVLEAIGLGTGVYAEGRSLAENAQRPMATPDERYTGRTVFQCRLCPALYSGPVDREECEAEHAHDQP